jgi:glycosyltransferase involved in cell wall biosynthesis
METCHALVRRGHVVTLVVRPDSHAPARDPFSYYDLAPIPGMRIEHAPVTGPPIARRAGYLAFAAGRTVGASRADIALTRDLGVASTLLRIPRALRPPLVYESHGYAPGVAAALPDLIATATAPSSSKLARLERREAFVWRTAEGYVTITAGLAAEMRTRFGERRLAAIVPDGTRIDADYAHGTRIDADPANEASSTESRPADYGPKPPVPGPRPIVAYAGHLYAWKGVDVLLDALAQLEEVRGWIVGGLESEPDLARLRDRAADLGVLDRVTFTGLVRPAAVAGHLRAADVLVLPNPASAISTRFTSPLKLFEYMAAGRPIVASDLPAITEVLRHEKNALLVAPGDPAALAAAVRRLLNDHALADRLAQAALVDAGEYSWDRRGERLEALFQQVTHSAR